MCKCFYFFSKRFGAELNIFLLLFFVKMLKKIRRDDSYKLNPSGDKDILKF